jgi:histone H2A
VAVPQPIARSAAKSVRSRLTLPTKRTRAVKSGLVFPVTKIQKMLRRLSIKDRLSNCSDVYLSAVLEYLTAEILDIAGNGAVKDKRKRIKPRDILDAM